MTARKILVLNGPNLNMLGIREPAVYGRETLDDVERACVERAEALGLVADCRQSNHEGQMVDWIQQVRLTHAGIILNAGAYSHTSIAIPDALAAVALPMIEVHLSNIYKREPFRHHSYMSAAARGVICGLGGHGYLLALDAMARLLDDGKN